MDYNIYDCLWNRVYIIHTSWDVRRENFVVMYICICVLMNILYLIIFPRSLEQVCRVAYEIMQTLHPDASSYFHSLDDIYYFGGQNAHNQVAIYAHRARGQGEIALEPGDVVGVAGNHWDGFSKGMNRKSGQTGLYPSYKVKEKIETVKYPTYQEADKLLNKQ